MSTGEERLGFDDEAPTGIPRGRGRPRSKTASPAEPHEEIELDHADQLHDSYDDLTEDERFEIFVNEYNQSILPDIPVQSGYHVCWATTSNPHDSVQRRLQIGYQLIRIDDTPGWEGVSLKTGDYAGCIGINEMVAMRIPLRLYNRMMNHVHHKLPMQDEHKLQAKLELIKNGLQESGSYVREEGDGSADPVQRAAAPVYQY